MFFTAANVAQELLASHRDRPNRQTDKRITRLHQHR